MSTEPRKPYLHTLDITRTTPAEDKPPPAVRRYQCPMCEHLFSVVNGHETEICPACDSQCEEEK